MKSSDTPYLSAYVELHVSFTHCSETRSECTTCTAMGCASRKRRSSRAPLLCVWASTRSFTSDYLVNVETLPVPRDKMDTTPFFPFCDVMRKSAIYTWQRSHLFQSHGATASGRNAKSVPEYDADVSEVKWLYPHEVREENHDQIGRCQPFGHRRRKNKSLIFYYRKRSPCECARRSICYPAALSSLPRLGYAHGVTAPTDITPPESSRMISFAGRAKGSRITFVVCIQ